MTEAVSGLDNVNVDCNMNDMPVAGFETADVCKVGLKEIPTASFSNDEGNVEGNITGEPDCGNKEGTQATGAKKLNPRVSFRDKVVGESSVKAIGFADSLVGDKMAVISTSTEDDIPDVCFHSEARDALSEPYRNAIVIKVLGKHVGYTYLLHRLRGVWRIKGGFHVMDVGYGYFLVKFDLPEDREKVLTAGPWTIGDHYLAVKPWNSSFISSEKSFGTTLVWIRISGLNMWCYHENAMMRIAEAIGKPIKIDLATKSADRGRYARACIEINLTEKIKKKIRIDGNVFDVEYENLPLICDICNCFGHEKNNCGEQILHSAAPSNASGTEQPVVKDDQRVNDSVDIKNMGAGQSSGTEKRGDEFHANSESLRNQDTANGDKEDWTLVGKKGKKIVNHISVGGTKGVQINKGVQAKNHVLGRKGTTSTKKNNASGASSSYQGVNIASNTCSLQTPIVANSHKRQRPRSLQNSPVDSTNLDHNHRTISTNTNPVKDPTVIQTAS